ncbi:hypothetical protein PAMP_008037 [Pampus punctatissimus]
MADKTLSTPQRSEGPFHACPGAGRAAESWWPAGSLDPVQSNAIMPSAISARFELPAVWRHRAAKTGPVERAGATSLSGFTDRGNRCTERVEKDKREMVGGGDVKVLAGSGKQPRSVHCPPLPH